MANLSVYPGLGLQIADFDNHQVQTANNPDSTFGYAHGPIPDPNPDWKPAAHVNAIAAGQRRYDIKAADIAGNNGPPNPPNTMSKWCGGVCWVAVNGPQMCGMLFSEGPALRRHIRNAHSGALVNPDRSAVSQSERIFAENALRKYVLSCGWRNASFLNEPGRGPSQGVIGHYCDALERFAREDAQFAATYGERFHRYQLPPTPGSAHRSRRVAPTVPANPIPFPGYASATSTQGVGNGAATGTEGDELEEENEEENEEEDEEEEE